MTERIARSKWDQGGSEKHTPAQRRMLNAVCGDLADQIDWFGNRMDKDDWRHWLCSVATKYSRMVPGYADGEGSRGFVVLGKSSLQTSKGEMRDAITMGLHIGDAPWDQGLDCERVQWCDAVLFGIGHNPNDLRAA